MFVRVLPLVLAAVCVAAPLHAQPLRARLLGQGFTRPIAVVVDPVVTSAVHVVQQNGLVLTFVNGVPRGAPFLDLTSVVTAVQDERGLLGMAFPPDAATSGRVFVNFTDRSSPGNTVIARFTRSAADPLVVDPASRFDLRFPGPGGVRQPFITQPYANHNGGNLAFGPDGYLYIGMGDGGAGDDPDNHAQTPTSLLGKMLRIDVSGSAANGYVVPPGNPDFTMVNPPIMNALPEIWAFGLRNPWRYSFDNVGPGATGALVIGDVGQSAREEINYEPAGQGGRNYGWSVFEGKIENPVNAGRQPAYQPLTAPMYDYTRASGQVITGGYVNRGTALGPSYQGRYFYADCGSGRIWSLAVSIAAGEGVASDNRDHTSELGGPFRCITSFARDAAGDLYFMDFDPLNAVGSGRVFRLEAGASTVAPGTPTNLTANVTGNNVALTWGAPASGGAPTGYVLQAGYTPGGVEIGAIPASSTGLAFANVPNGQYYVRVLAVNGAGASAPTSDVALTVGCTATPAAPTSFNTGITGNVVGLNWNVEAGTTQTVLEVGYAPGTTALTFAFNAPTAGLSVTAPPATYYVRVRAVNTCGQSPPSVERTIVVP
jgi:glucose/arabinose dehydrogenase